MVTFNAFVSKTQQIGGNTPIWLGVVKPLPVGGVLASAFVAKDAYFGAGYPVELKSGTVTPFYYWVVKAVDSTNHVLTVYKKEYAPAADDFLMPVGATFATTGAVGKVSAVADSSTEGCIDVTFTDAKLDSLVEGAIIAYADATAVASSGKSLKVQPNGYLYNDVYLGNETLDTNATATCAVVAAHNEGILINRTAAYTIAKQMLNAVPNVIQVVG